MTRKTAIGWLIMLLAALVLASCGTDDNPPETPEVPETEETGEIEETEENASGGDQIEGQITSTLTDKGDGTYRYIVKNDTEEAVTFNFTSGQRYDFSLIDEQGNEAFRMSSVSMYTQALGEETVRQGEELHYDLQVPEANLETGTYTLEVWLTPTELENYVAETEHTVE